MRRGAANAAATADALLAWLDIQARVRSTAAPAKNDECPQETALVQDRDGSNGGFGWAYPRCCGNRASCG